MEQDFSLDDELSFEFAHQMELHCLDSKHAARSEPNGTTWWTNPKVASEHFGSDGPPP